MGCDNNRKCGAYTLSDHAMITNFRMYGREETLQLVLWLDWIPGKNLIFGKIWKVGYCYISDKQLTEFLWLVVDLSFTCCKTLQQNCLGIGVGGGFGKAFRMVNGLAKLRERRHFVSLKYVTIK